ncbi:MAG: hypothetical protein EOO85_24425 [Pedobacter sp.]|nr:MAG: hypothetical protein EOO85_24425 [Pedobacter sp.]
MKNKTWCLWVIMMLIGISSYSQSRFSQKELAKLYRQYVLQQCMYHGYEQDSVFHKDISLSIINDISDYPTLNSHGRMLDSLVVRKLKSIEPTTIPDYEDNKPIFLDIVEYYDSKELKKDVWRILKSPKIPRY